jgi:rhodanese-related sulfurtransferase
VLDVRRDDERAGGGIEGSVHIPLQHLLERLDDLPPQTLWVHCATGFRASIASSLLDRAGHDVVHIDDEWSNASEAGLVVVAPPAGERPKSTGGVGSKSSKEQPKNGSIGEESGT